MVLFKYLMHIYLGEDQRKISESSLSNVNGGAPGLGGVAGSLGRWVIEVVRTK